MSHGLPGLGDPGCQPGSVLFLPQKPYMVLGSLRDQMLYPTWTERPASDGAATGDGGTGASDRTAPAPPDDAALEAALRKVQLSSLLDRCCAAARGGRGGGGGGAAGGEDVGGSGISGGGTGASPLDCVADWSQLLSLGALLAPGHAGALPS